MPATLQPQVNPEATKNNDTNLPKTPAQAKLWPLDAGAKAVEGLIQPPTVPTTPNTATTPTDGFGSATTNPTGEEQPAKKKRKRTRKRKKPATATPAE
jgi:hypothetical protein